MMTYSEKIKHKVGTSISLKLVVIGILLLVLQIPLIIFDGLIDERKRMHQQAKAQISQQWGGAQVIGAPLLNVAYQALEKHQQDTQWVDKNRQILPLQFDLDIQLEASTRYFGIYESSVYVTTLNLTGLLEFNPAKQLQSIDNWQLTSLFLPIQSLRGLKQIKSAKLNGLPIELAADQPALGGLSGVSFALPTSLVVTENETIPQQWAFEIELELAGSNQFRVMPMAGQTEVKMQSNWPSPSFSGDFLPESRTITDDGFSAQWQVNELNHHLGRVLNLKQSSHSRGEHASYNQNWSEFGVRVLIPANTYLVNERTIKYSLLIMLLTFAGFFLAEVFFKLRLHPFQYLLIGFSLSLFYLLLLSFSEHIPFDYAFFVSALAVIVLIGGYCAVILKQRKRGFFTAGLFAVLYAFIFILVKAEQFSLLMGAIGIWVFMAAVMYLTRKIDWYAPAIKQDTP